MRIEMGFRRVARVLVLPLVLAFGVLAGCANQKPGGQLLDETIQVEATVVELDSVERMLVLEGPDGDQLLVAAGDQVKNFDQIEEGDRVKMSYTEAVAWQVKKASEGAPGVTAGAVEETAAPGEKPSGSVRSSVTVTTTITDIDLAAGTATLTGADGESLTVKAADPANLRKVQVGDLVDITYSRAVAVSILPVDGK